MLITARCVASLSRGSLFLASCLVLILLAAPAYAGNYLTLLSNNSANQAGGVSAGEIVAFDPFTDRLFVTSSGVTDTTNPVDYNTGVYRINIFGIANPASPTTIGTIDFSTTFGTAADMFGLSSVAVDPLGRFGVATLIPSNPAITVSTDSASQIFPSTSVPGKVGFFNLSSGALIGTANAGFHPDSVSFSADGSKLVVVNEGEFVQSSNISVSNSPGSISIFDISGINSGNLATLPSLVATTTDFSPGNLDAGVSLSGVRSSNLAGVGLSGAFIGTVPNFVTEAGLDANYHRAIEPEYATIVGNKVYVSLQDNNAIAEYDLTDNKWTEVKNLGTISQLVDASDQDGPGGAKAIKIDDTVRGLPMPDTVGSYVVGGKTYIVTANEGDARVDDRDVSRFGDINGNDSMNTIVDQNAPSNFPVTQTGARANDVLGRLNVSRLDGDTDADGKIDAPTMIGTRSFSIYEDTPGGLVRQFDSGSFFEEFLRVNDSGAFNGLGVDFDSRSDDKGPEPEGLVLGEIGGRTYAFIGMERSSGIFMFDISNPLAPAFKDYIRVIDGVNSPLRPEGFTFVSAADSPTGTSLLIVGFEGDGTLASSERFVILSVVPEPASCLLLAGGAICLLRTVRRRRLA